MRRIAQLLLIFLVCFFFSLFFFFFLSPSLPSFFVFHSLNPLNQRSNEARKLNVVEPHVNVVMFQELVDFSSTLKLRFAGYWEEANQRHQKRVCLLLSLLLLFSLLSVLRFSVLFFGENGYGEAEILVDASAVRSLHARTGVGWRVSQSLYERRGSPRGRAAARKSWDMRISICIVLSLSTFFCLSLTFFLSFLSSFFFLLFPPYCAFSSFLAWFFFFARSSI